MIDAGGFAIAGGFALGIVISAAVTAALIALGDAATREIETMFGVRGDGRATVRPDDDAADDDQAVSHVQRNDSETIALTSGNGGESAGAAQHG